MMMTRGFCGRSFAEAKPLCRPIVFMLGVVLPKDGETRFCLYSEDKITRVIPS